MKKLDESDISTSPNLHMSDLNKWGLFVDGIMIFFSSNKDAVSDFKDSLSRS